MSIKKHSKKIYIIVAIISFVLFTMMFMDRRFASRQRILKAPDRHKRSEVVADVTKTVQQQTTVIKSLTAYVKELASLVTGIGGIVLLVREIRGGRRTKRA